MAQHARRIEWHQLGKNQRAQPGTAIFPLYLDNRFVYTVLCPGSAHRALERGPTKPRTPMFWFG